MSLSENKKVYNIILDRTVKESIEKIARLEGRSNSNLINHILKKYIGEYEGDLS